MPGLYAPSCASLRGIVASRFVGKPTSTQSITGTVVRVRGGNTLEVRADDGDLHRVHLTSRFSQALQNGRHDLLQTLRSGQTVIVIGKVLNGKFWAVEVRADSED